MKFLDWVGHCQTYADWRYCYSDLVDDHIEAFSRLYDAGTTVSAAVLEIGEKYDLEDCTVDWGIHQTTPCPLDPHTANATK